MTASDMAVIAATKTTAAAPMVTIFSKFESIFPFCASTVKNKW